MSVCRMDLEDQNSEHKTLASCSVEASTPPPPPRSSVCTTLPAALKGSSQDFLGHVGGGDQCCLGSSLNSLHLQLGHKPLSMSRRKMQ